MALQTTLAAWVRTATLLIGFGFAIVQFLEHFGRLESGGGPKAPHFAPIVGLVLISTGSLTTAIAMWEYRTAVKYLEGDGFRGVAGIPTIRREPPDVAVWMAFLVFLIGVLAFAVDPDHDRIALVLPAKAANADGIPWLGSTIKT